jgi:flagellar motility protein MotE (MotC chaperone)
VFEGVVALVVFLAAAPATEKPTAPTPPKAAQPTAPAPVAPSAPAPLEPPAQGAPAPKAGTAPAAQVAPRPAAPVAPAATTTTAAPKGPTLPAAPTAPTRGSRKTAKRETVVPPGAADRPVPDRAERILGMTPPSLTGSALRNEARHGGPLDEKGPLSERQRLEQLVTEIKTAREALRQDTARLEQMLKGGGRMPMGDGMDAQPAPLNPKDVSQEQLNTVSKAMKGMKPEQAGAIIARLDRYLAAEILRRMRPDDAGQVLGQIKPELAAELATIIATKKPTGAGAAK